MTDIAPDMKKKVVQNISTEYGLSEPTLNQEWEKWSQQQSSAEAGFNVTASATKIKAWFMNHLTSQGMIAMPDSQADDDYEDEDEDDSFPILDAAGEYESGDEDEEDDLDAIINAGDQAEIFKHDDEDDEDEDDLELSQAKAYAIKKEAASHKDFKVNNVGDLLDRLDLDSSNSNFEKKQDSEKVSVETLLAHIGLETCPVTGRLQPLETSASMVIGADFRLYGAEKGLRTWAMKHRNNPISGNKQGGKMMRAAIAELLVVYRRRLRKRRGGVSKIQVAESIVTLVNAVIILIAAPGTRAGSEAKRAATEALRTAKAFMMHEEPKKSSFTKEELDNLAATLAANGEFLPIGENRVGRTLKKAY